MLSVVFVCRFHYWRYTNNWLLHIAIISKHTWALNFFKLFRSPHSKTRLLVCVVCANTTRSYFVCRCVLWMENAKIKTKILISCVLSNPFSSTNAANFSSNRLCVCVDSAAIMLLMLRMFFFCICVRALSSGTTASSARGERGCNICRWTNRNTICKDYAKNAFRFRRNELKKSALRSVSQTKRNHHELIRTSTHFTNSRAHTHTHTLANRKTQIYITIFLPFVTTTTAASMLLFGLVRTSCSANIIIKVSALTLRCEGERDAQINSRIKTFSYVNKKWSQPNTSRHVQLEVNVRQIVKYDEDEERRRWE